MTFNQDLSVEEKTFLKSFHLLCFGQVGYSRGLAYVSLFPSVLYFCHLCIFVCILHLELVCVVCSHLSAVVRGCAAQHLADLLERVGVSRLMSGGMTDRILPAVVKLALDSSPEPRHVELPVTSCVW